MEPPYLIEGHATGELEGVGVWRLFAGAGEHGGALLVAGPHHEAVDEHVGPVAAPGVSLEP